MRSILLLAVPAVAFAIPLDLTHQGRILATTGDPLVGEHSVDVDLYDSQNGNGLLWDGPTQANVVFQDGYFTVFLAVPASALAGNSVWMEITVDGSQTLSRTPFTSVPYAVRAGQVDGPVNATELKVNDVVATPTLGTLGASCAANTVPVADGSGGWSCQAYTSNPTSLAQWAKDVGFGATDADTQGTSLTGDLYGPWLLVGGNAGITGNQLCADLGLVAIGKMMNDLGSGHGNWTPTDSSCADNNGVAEWAFDCIVMCAPPQ